MKKKILILFGILISPIIGLIMVFLCLNLFFGRDEPPIDDSDLLLPKIEILQKNNAFYYLNKAGENLFLPEEKENLFDNMVDGKQWDSEFAKELIINNKKLFDYFEQSVNVSQFALPGLENPEEVWAGTILVPMSPYRKVIDMNVIKSNYLFKQGKQKQAFDQCVKIIKIGNLMQESRTMIAHITGSRIKEIGCNQIITMLPNTNLSTNTLKFYANELEQLKSDKTALKNTLKMEYASSINSKEKMIDIAFADEDSDEELKRLGVENFSFQEKAMSKLNYFYKPNKTQRMIAEDYRFFMNNADKDYYNEMELFNFEPLTPNSKIKIMFTENLIGKMLYDITAVNYSALLSRKCENDFTIIACQTLLAIKAYENEGGTIPATLDNLMPRYISKIYNDPFDGEGIRYSADQKIIYSVGKDLKDSGGDKEGAQDIVFNIEI